MGRLSVVKYARFFCIATALAVFCLPLQAQTADDCRLPGSLRSNKRPNMFTPEQEEWIGAIMDRGIRRDYNVIEDPEGYLQKLGEKILAQLPPTGIHFQFVLIDSPELNSFGLIGGRIYIHRRMIAFSRNEDELAALLGHEIGHMIDHHVAIHLTDYFRQLDIASLGDRQDILNKWNRFKDNQGRVKNHSGEKGEMEEQLIADRIGLYGLTRAGYNSDHMIEF